VGAGYTIRGPEPGDIGHVVSRHAAIYNAEFGWDWTFEAMVARVAADFIEAFDPATDCCLIAEAGGKAVGSAFVVATGEPGVAKLRLVYVEADMRGTGLGQALVTGCIAFAREAGYQRMRLWTNDILVPARRLYDRLGFVMVAREPYCAFGKDLVGETWERHL
jgi:GNAT superfamily N-acetyltransferase